MARPGLGSGAKGRRRRWGRGLVAALVVCGLLTGCNRGPTEISVSDAAAYPFTGWGTSLAWWANVVGGWPASPGSPRTQILDALFGRPDVNDPAHGPLGFTVARYNLGAGPSDPKPDPAHPGQTFSCPELRPGGSVPVLQSADGRWDLEADRNQLGVLADAQARGADVLEAFANSPPAWMTVSGCASGNTGGADNLAAGNRQRYADYLVGALTRLRAAKGVTFGTVEPFNEADDGFPWSPQCGPCQEGANFAEASQDEVITDLCAAVAASGLPTTIAAPDANNFPDAVRAYRGYSPAAQSCLSQVNAHGYGSDDGLSNGDGRSDLAAIGKPVWMSEVGHGGNPQDIDSALKLSRQVVGDLQDLHARAWVYWQAVEQPGDQYWGLIQVPFSGDSPPVRTKRFSVISHYSAFIRPNAQILHATDSHASTVVARDPVSGQVVVVATNDSGSTRSVRFDLTKFAPAGATVTAYRTTKDADLAKVGAGPSLDHGKLADDEPASSITTYLVTPAGAGAGVGVGVGVGAAAPTAVKTFEPWMRNARSGEAVPADGLRVTSLSGTCDSGAQADPGRAEAFRCTGDDGVRRDVCLVPTPPLRLAGGEGLAVLCSDDPTSSRAVLLSLTTPAPTGFANGRSDAADPWYLVLADGSHCARAGSGTDTDVLAYSCTDGTQVTAPDRTNPVWTVQKGRFTTQSRTPVLTPDRIPVREAYR